MKIAASLLRWAALGVALLGVFLAAAGLLLLRTQAGHDLFLRTALNQASRIVNGELSVRGLSSGGLLQGFTLHGVTVADESARPFVRADSIRVRYSISDLLRRQIVLVPVEIWRPVVVIETLSGDANSNVKRIFAGLTPDSLGGPDDGEAASSGVKVALRETQLHDGSLIIRIPVEEGSPVGRTVRERLEGSGEGYYQILSFSEVEARVSSADILDPAREGQSFRIEHLAFVGHVLDEPFTITELRGALVRAGAGIQLEAARVRLPGTLLVGHAGVRWGEPEGLSIEAALEAEEFQFDAFRWLEPSLPIGGGRLSLTVSGPANRTSLRAAGIDLTSGGSRVRGSIGLDLGSGLRLTETDLELGPLRMSDLGAWLEEPLPFAGEMSGSLTAEGPLDELRMSGDLDFHDPDLGAVPSEFTVDGTLDIEGGFTATDLLLNVDPLRYPSLATFFPELALEGSGRASFRVSGDLGSAFQLNGRLEHQVGGGPRSSLSVSGAVQRSNEEWALSLAASLDPLSLDGLAAGLQRPLPVGGEVSGSLRAAGPVSGVELTASVSTEGGPIDAVARLNLLEPLSSYRVEASIEEFRVDRLTPRLPEPTVLTGRGVLDGAGFLPEELSGTAQIALTSSRVGNAELEGFEARFQATDGRLIVDELSLRSPVLELSGTGNLALRNDESDAVVSLTWAADSLALLRPVVLGPEVIAADTLTQLERDVLRLEGIDPDTLGAVEQVAIGGSARGEASLSGNVRDLSGVGFAEFQNLVLGESSLARSLVDLSGAWTTGDGWNARAELHFDSLTVRQFGLRQGEGTLSLGSGGSGDFALEAEGGGGQSYSAEGTLQHDSLGLELGLRGLEARAESGTWALEGNALLRLEGSSLRTDELRIRGPRGADGSQSVPTSIVARGTVGLDRASAFELDLSDLDLDRLSQVTQMRRLPGGIVDLGLVIEGPWDGLSMDGSLVVRDLDLRAAAFSRMEGRLAYHDRRLRGQVTGDHLGRRIFSVNGELPLDLSFGAIENRLPDDEIDLVASLDSLPASTLLAFSDVFGEVNGSLDGQVRLRGTSKDPRPSGEIRLRDGGMTIEGLGLGPVAVSADLRVREDLQIELEALARAQGQAVVTGTVGIAELTNPEFNLVLSATGFQAVNRRDLTARIAGDVTLGGSYSRPEVGGAVTVEQGELFLEEFVRGAQVIDLTDPRFFDVVDTTLVASRPLSGFQRSGFLQNLRVNVELGLEQDFWIRSQESIQGMDVEIAGDLGLTFDRPARELLLSGSLEAIRGSYLQFGRRFEVESGDVEFVGTPGIDPSLSIQAVHRLRRAGAEPLNVIATVAGTLQSPEVTLSSDAQPPIPESDLISYLLFGRPSYALASNETSVFDGALAGSISTASNLFVSQLGSSFGRSLGVDYLSVSQAQHLGGIGAFRHPTGLFADTQIEMGRYVSDNVFFAVSIRPLTGLGPIRRTQLPGARLEWTFKEFWSAEGFLEDRLANPGGSGFGELDNAFARVFGLSVFREWGY